MLSWADSNLHFFPFVATLSIISIGGTIVAQEGMRVLMDCLVVGYPPVDWTFDIVE